MDHENRTPPKTVQFFNYTLDKWELNPIKINSIFLLILLLFFVINSYSEFLETKNISESLKFILATDIGIDNLYKNILALSSNLISFASALITLNGVFLTLLVTLKESAIFENLKLKFPNLHDYMYSSLKKQLISCIILIFILIVTTVIFSHTIIIIKLILIVLIIYLLVNVTIGGIYTVKVVGNLTTKDADSTTPPMK